MHRLLIPLLQVLLAAGLGAAEFTLLKDGKAVSQMIVAEDAPLPVQYAARELARYEHGKNKGYPIKGQTGVLEFAVDSDAWETFSLTVDKADEPRLYVRFFHQQGTVRLDDVIVTPVGEE